MTHGRLCLLGLAQHRHCMTVEFLARVGHPEAPGGAIEQPDPEVGLELPDAVAQRRFWHVESPTGGGEATPINHLHETGKVVQVEHTSSNRPFGWTGVPIFGAFLANRPGNSSQPLTATAVFRTRQASCSDCAEAKWNDIL